MHDYVVIDYGFFNVIGLRDCHFCSYRLKNVIVAILINI
jgi:hypothetical protein